MRGGTPCPVSAPASGPVSGPVSGDGGWGGRDKGVGGGRRGGRGRVRVPPVLSQLLPLVLSQVLSGGGQGVRLSCMGRYPLFSLGKPQTGQGVHHLNRNGGTPWVPRQDPHHPEIVVFRVCLFLPEELF